jgi:hypothetical protein
MVVAAVGISLIFIEGLGSELHSGNLMVFLCAIGFSGYPIVLCQNQSIEMFSVLILSISYLTLFLPDDRFTKSSPLSHNKAYISLILESFSLRWRFAGNVIKLLEKFKKMDVPYVFISHELASFADDVVVLYAGKVVEKGSAVEVFQTPWQPYTKLLLASASELPKGWLEGVADTKERGLQKPAA